MQSVELRVLKRKLREYVHRVAGGESILVIERGDVVAELVPPRDDRRSRATNADLAQAIRMGWITLPALPQAGVATHLPSASWKVLEEELAQDRSDR